MDRAVFYGIVTGGVFGLCMLFTLNCLPIAVFGSTLFGYAALVRGLLVWG